MPISLDEYIRSLSTCGLISVEEVRAFLDEYPRDLRPTCSEDLARELVLHERLTKFQAAAIYQGKGANLLMGNYLLVEPIGQGGMGKVYKAKQKKMDRIVALKLLSGAAMRSPEAVKRFQREARAAGKLAHPNIVTAYDADEDHGRPYLVTEYVDGENLSAIVREHGVLSLGRAVDFILQAARGLEYAHANGVIHRDIKPANLLLDKQGTIKILDMGIARVNEFVGQVAFGSADEVTSSGVIVGTPDYMSPEQSNDIRVADARSDIYSLGCTLYFVLTGQPVFPGDTVLQKIIAHRDKPPPFLREYRGDVPEGLEKIFQRMLAKRPQERHRSMTDVIAEIQKCITARQQTADNTAGGPYVLDDTVRSGAQKAVTAAVSSQPTTPAMPSLVEEWLVDEPGHVAALPGLPTTSVFWRRRRRRLLKIAAWVAAALLLAVIAISQWLGSTPGTLYIEIQGSGGILEVTTLDGKPVLKCPAASGPVSLPTKPGRYRIKITKQGVDQYVHEVAVPAGGQASALVKLDDPRPTGKQ